MTPTALYREPVLLEHAQHRHLKLKRVDDHSHAAGLHSSFVGAAEFTLAARDYAIVFVAERSEGGAARSAGVRYEPAVLLGVVPGENLFVDGAHWDARYLPAFVRRYPFALARVEGADAPAVMIDRAFAGCSETDGEPLYAADGVAAPRLAAAIEFMTAFDHEASRTFAFCERLAELGLLRELAAKVTLADGSTLGLDGLHAVDETALRALPDAAVLELHRNGVLGLVHAHLLSLANLQGLVDRKGRRMRRAAAD